MKKIHDIRSFFKPKQSASATESSETEPINVIHADVTSLKEEQPQT